VKIFENMWDKVNFVDENNVFLGYDLSQQCCEKAGWFLAHSPQETIPEETGGEFDLDGFTFDTDFFKEIYDLAIFRIVKKDEECFIHLFNTHDGYYSHGFKFTCGNTVIKDSKL
jgi:hypothetical protein